VSITRHSQKHYDQPHLLGKALTAYRSCICIHKKETCLHYTCIPCKWKNHCAL